MSEGSSLSVWRPSKDLTPWPRPAWHVRALVGVTTLACLAAHHPGTQVLGLAIGLLWASFEWASERAIRLALTLPAEFEDETYAGKVILHLSYNGLGYGADVGDLHIDGPFIHFHGQRCEFSISSRTSTYRPEPSGPSIFKRPNQYSVEFTTGFRATFEPLRRPSDLESKLRNALALPDPSTGPMSFPPVRPSSPWRLPVSVVAETIKKAWILWALPDILQRQLHVDPKTTVNVLIAGWVVGIWSCLTMYSSMVKQLSRSLDRLGSDESDAEFEEAQLHSGRHGLDQPLTTGESSP